MNIISLLGLFSPKTLLAHKNAPAIKGRVQLETRENGKLRQCVEGYNVWTLTGREYLAELITLAQASPRVPLRDDRIRYIGLGIGAQPELATVTNLVNPVPFASGQFLAPVNVPANFPDNPNPAVQFIRTYGLTEISLGGTNVILTEAGLFTDGDPLDNWSLFEEDVPGFEISAGFAPMAYKTFEPITKTTQFTLKLVWEVNFV
jgi:hypothetical protein